MSQFQLPAHRDLFYGGGWHQAAGGTAATVSPSSGQALGSFAVAGTEDVDRAVAAARAGFAEWRRVAPLERARVLREMARRLAARRDELAWIDAVDGGSPVRELRNDVDTAVAQLDFFAGLVTEMKGTSVPMGPGVVNFSVREPLGVVVRIIPFNHPFMFCAGKPASALAAGNAVIVKLPEQAPLSALRIAELAGEPVPARGLLGRDRRRRDRSGAGQPPRGGQGGADRQRERGPGGAAGRGRPYQARPARAGWEERADRLRRRRSRRGRPRGRGRHELRLVRPVLRLDQPRLPARRHPRRGARPGPGRAEADQAGAARGPGHHHGRAGEPGPPRPGARLHRPGAGRGRAAGGRAADRRPSPGWPTAVSSSRRSSPT